jgi:hypothetical protein
MKKMINPENGQRKIKPNGLKLFAGRHLLLPANRKGIILQDAMAHPMPALIAQWLCNRATIVISINTGQPAIQ